MYGRSHGRRRRTDFVGGGLQQAAFVEHGGKENAGCRSKANRDPHRGIRLSGWSGRRGVALLALVIDGRRRLLVEHGAVRRRHGNRERRRLKRRGWLGYGLAIPVGELDLSVRINRHFAQGTREDFRLGRLPRLRLGGLWRLRRPPPPR